MLPFNCEPWKKAGLPGPLQVRRESCALTFETCGEPAFEQYCREIVRLNQTGEFGRMILAIVNPAQAGRERLLRFLSDRFRQGHAQAAKIKTEIIKIRPVRIGLKGKIPAAPGGLSDGDFAHGETHARQLAGVYSSQQVQARLRCGYAFRLRRFGFRLAGAGESQVVELHLQIIVYIQRNLYGALNRFALHRGMPAPRRRIYPQMHVFEHLTVDIQFTGVDIHECENFLQVLGRGGSDVAEQFGPLIEHHALETAIYHEAAVGFDGVAMPTAEAHPSPPDHGVRQLQIEAQARSRRTGDVLDTVGLVDLQEKR